MSDAYRLDKARVRASFDRAARSYDAAAVLQKEVRERMLSRLDFVKIAPQTIVDAGCGTGHAGRALARRFAASRVISLDIALGMLQVTSTAQPWLQRFLSRARSSLLCADFENLPLKDASAGLVWSNLVVQWCNDLDEVFRESYRVLQSGGLLMFSTFGPDTLKELRQAATADPDYVHVSRFIDMHDIGDALVRCGFTAPVLDMENFVLTYDDVVSVMRDLKAIGAHNAAEGRRRGLEGKGFLRKLTEGYERFRANDKLPATFEVVYGHAWKPETRIQPADGSVPITIHKRK
jgi:malonyl-CoA O-methyltransferase